MSKQTNTILDAFKQCSKNGLQTEAVSKSMMKSFHSKLKEDDIAMTCPKCSFVVPKYQGRYPNSCPDCGENFKEMFADKSAKEVENAFKVGESVKCKVEEQEYDATIVSKCMESGKFTVMLKNNKDMSGKLIREVEIGNLSAPAIMAKEDNKKG